MILGGGLPTALQVKETLLSPSSRTSLATRVISTRGASGKKKLMECLRPITNSNSYADMNVSDAELNVFDYIVNVSVVI